jgi:hypothetical protein
MTKPTKKTEKPTNVIKLIQGGKADKVKLKGEAFERVKKIYERNEALIEESNKWIHERNEKIMANHKELWELIGEVSGFDTKKTSLRLNTDYASMGLYFVEKKKPEEGLTDSLLAALLRQD